MYDCIKPATHWKPKSLLFHLLIFSFLGFYCSTLWLWFVLESFSLQLLFQNVKRMLSWVKVWWQIWPVKNLPLFHFKFYVELTVCFGSLSSCMMKLICKLANKMFQRTSEFIFLLSSRVILSIKISEPSLEAIQSHDTISTAVHRWAWVL